MNKFAKKIGWYPVTFFGWFLSILYTLLLAYIVLDLNYKVFGKDFNTFALYTLSIFFMVVVLFIARLSGKQPFIKHPKKTDGGWTVIEILITVSIIAILANYVLPALQSAREKATFARAMIEFTSVNESLNQYLNDYGEYPPDSNRDIPPGLEQYLAPGIWPEAAWKGSVFDWDNWEDPDDSTKRIYQISVRFCPIGQPDECRFPNEDWAENFDINSSVYYCIQGACRPHINRPIDHPGYCVNCN